MDISLKQKRTLVASTETHYLEGGTLGNQALIFFHGWAIRASTFETSLSQLSAHFHVFAPDLPGFGSTDKFPRGATYPHYAEFCVQFMDQLNIKRAHILGHSFGGGVCAATAALYPERIQSLVLINSAGIPLPPIHTLAIPRLTEVVFQAARSAFVRHNLYIIKDFLSSWVLRPFTTSEVMEIPVMQDVRPLLRKIVAPTLIAWGRHDCIIPVESAEIFHALIKDSEIAVVDDGYHEWSVVQPKKFVNIVRNFYRNHGFFSGQDMS